jgi:DNA-binding transcriptional ArsR family regulator
MLVSQVDPASQERMRALAEARELRLFLVTAGDLVRLQVLRQLAQREEMSVTELVRAVRVSQPLLSWHLGVLKRMGLVCVRRDGRLVWYALNDPVLRSFCQRFALWIGMDAAFAAEEGEGHDQGHG